MAALPTPDGSEIAVITVSYGSEGVLPGLLKSVPQSTGRSPIVIVTDNKPESRSTRAMVESNGARYLPLGANRGYGAAVNAAARTLPASVTWILVVNPDVELGDGALDRLVEVGEADPTIGSVGPLVRNSDGTVYPSARAIPSLRTGIGHALFANLWDENPWTRAYKASDAPDDRQRDAGWLSGSCVLVRRVAFDRLGGFDDGYFMYFEDVDLGRRLSELKYRNVFVPAAEVMHSGAHSTTSDSAAMIAAHHESARRFLAKKYAGPLLWPVRTALSIGLQLRARGLRRRIGS